VGAGAGALLETMGAVVAGVAVVGAAVGVVPAAGEAEVVAGAESPPEPEHAARTAANSNTLDRRRHVLAEPMPVRT
jgi:hypothetical protein